MALAIKGGSYQGSVELRYPTAKPLVKRQTRARRNRATDRKGRVGWRLVDEVPNFREYTVTQFHTHQACTEWGVQVLFKTLQHVGRQIRLLPKHFQQRQAIGRVLVVAG